MSISSDINSSLQFLQNIQRQKLSEYKEEMKADAARDKYLGDSRSLSRDVAYLSRQLLPDSAYKSSKAGGDLAPHMAIDNAFQDDDPMKGIGNEVMNIANMMQGRDIDSTGPQTLQAIFKDSLSRRLDDAYRYKLKQETSVFGKDTGKLPFYDKWKENWEQDPEGGKRDIGAYIHGVTPKGLATNAAMLTGMNIAAQGIGIAAKKAGWRTVAKLAGRGLFGLPAPGAPGFITKLAGVALMGLADFAMFDAGAGLVSQSHWAKARGDEPVKTAAAEMLAGGVVAFKGANAFKKIFQKVSEDKVVADSAIKMLEYKRDVPALMNYGQATKRLEGSTVEAQRRIGTFAAESKPDIKLYTLDQAGKEQPLSVYDTIESNWDDVIDATFKEVKTPELPPLQTNLLPAPIEKAIGSTVSRSGRTAMRMFYDFHKQGTAGIIKLWSTTPPPRMEMSPRNLDALHRYWANNPGRRTPTKFFGTDYGPLVGRYDRPSEVITGYSPGAMSKALSYGLEGKSYTAMAKMLDAPGVEEVVALTKEGINKEVGIVEAATKSQARKNNKSTVIRRKRDDSIVAAAKSDDKKTSVAGKELSEKVKASMPSAKISEKAKKFAAFREKKSLEDSIKKITKSAPKPVTLTPEEERIVLSGGVEVSRVPKDIRAFTTKKRVGNFKDEEIPIDAVIAGLRAHPEFENRNPVVEAVIRQIRNKQPGSLTVKGSILNQIIKASRRMEDVYGRKLLRPSLGAEISETSQKAIDEHFLKKIADADPTTRRKMWSALTLIPLSSAALLLADNEEAEAGVVGKTTVLAAEASKTLLKKLNQSNLVGVKGTELGKTERWMDGFSLKPTLDAIKQTESRVWSFLRNHVMTPGAVADLFYKGNMNPVVELASRMTAVHNNSQMHLKNVDEILSLVPGYKNVSTEVRQAMKPLVDKYQVPLAETAYYNEMLKSMRADLKKTVKKKDPELHQLLKDQIDIYGSRYNKSKERMKTYQAEWETTVKKLAAKHSSTRIALATEDTAEFKYYPWLKNMLDPHEQAAVSMLKDLNKVTQGRIEEVGGNVIKHRPFAHHALHPDTSFRKIKDALGSSTTNMDQALAYARLHSRSIGSRMMMPDVEYMYSKYVPDVERRIQMMKFWKKGQRGGWDAHRKDLERFGLMSGQLKEFWKLIDDGFKPPPQTRGAEWARRYYSMEVLRLLFMSPSVGFKHLMKQTGDIAIFGPKSIAKRAYQSPRVLSEVTRMKVRERWPTMFKDMDFNPSEEAKFVKATTNQGRYQSAIAELEFADAPINAFDNVLQKFNETGSVIVGTIENLDRAATVLAGLEMAAKKGLTPNQAMYSIYDSILRANFLSGPLNPKWIRDPYARAFFMFQGTPYKLMEQRIMRAAKAGKDIKAAFGVTLDELKAAKNFAKEGEYRVKNGMIMDALEAGWERAFKTKDVYGTPVTKQFMVNMLTLGGIIGAGDMLWDADLMDHVVHPPFFKPGSQGVGLALNPAIGAAYKAWNSRHEEDSELLFTEFFNKWMSSTGPFPSTFRKTLRLSKNDIPEIYQGDPWKYIFAVPATED